MGSICKRSKSGGVYVINVGHQFVDHLSSLLSLLSDHEDMFETYIIKMSDWMKKCNTKKTSNSNVSIISSQMHDIGSRMSQLFLKEDPVIVVPIAIDDGVAVLKEMLL
jgi:hypothetical protein